ETNICSSSFHAAAVCAGAGCYAVDRVMQIGGPKRVFVPCRPPGHHAGPSGQVADDAGRLSPSQGFCLLNSVAIAAAYARLAPYNYKGILQRIAIIDFDAHYGDGTAACVMNLRPRYRLRVVDGNPNILSIPLPRGTESNRFREIAANQMLPHLAAFRPNLIFLSSGFDGHAEDVLGNDGGLQLTEEDFKWFTLRVGEIADRYSEGRIISMLEGGYHL
ncbi:hypothetical protein GUITHDRAFT_55637, partial [Guillardia theta CCMP2712]